MFQTCSSQYKDFGCDALEICILKMHVRVITTYTSLPYVDTVAVQTGFCKGSNRALFLPPQPLDMRQGQGCGLCGRAPHMHAKGPRGLQGLGRRWIATVSQIKGNPGPCATWGWDCIMRI